MFSTIVFWAFLIICGLLIWDELFLLFIECYSGLNSPLTGNERFLRILRSVVVLSAAIFVAIGKLKQS